jgi:hypothetical protein
VSERSTIPPSFANRQTMTRVAEVAAEMAQAMAPLAESHAGDTEANVIVGNLMVINGISVLARNRITREDMIRVVTAMIDHHFDGTNTLVMAVPEDLALDLTRKPGGPS